RPFRRGQVPRRFDKLAKLGVRYFRNLHPETIDPNPMGGLFIGPAEVGVGAHRELAAGNPDHARRGTIRVTHDGERRSKRSDTEEEQIEAMPLGPRRNRWVSSGARHKNRLRWDSFGPQSIR